MTLPVATAIMPTRGRRGMAQAALDCWRLQTHANGELVVVDDIEDPSFPYGLFRIPQVTYMRISGHRSIGEKRNAACDLARGQFVVHFDSDDYSAPGRIADQVERLLATGKQVTGYHSMPFTDGKTRWQYCGDAHFALDTSLCYFKDFWERHPFDHVNDGLEFNFRAAAVREGVFVSVDAGAMMYATVHPGNTSNHNIDLRSESWRLIA